MIKKTSKTKLIENLIPFLLNLGKGFSVSNLENFRKFYLTFNDAEISYSLRRELTWTHYRLIMRVENPNAREYYVNECAEQMWSTRTLERNLNTFYYERLLSSKNKKEALLFYKGLKPPCSKSIFPEQGDFNRVFAFRLTLLILYKNSTLFSDKSNRREKS